MHRLQVRYRARMATTPTRRKRRLGTYLRDLRERTRLSADDAAGLIFKSRPTITRIESGHALPSPLELRTLLAAYGVTEDERTEALARLEDAKQDAVRLELPTGLPPKFRAFLRAEADAERLLIISITAVAGILQTREYARAVQESPTALKATDVATERILDVRFGRQRRLRGSDALRIHCVMDEAVIRRMVGGMEVMRSQLRQLLDVAALDTVTLQVMPFGAGVYGTMSGGLSVLTFADPQDPPMVYLEYSGGGALVEDSEDVSRYVATFEGVSVAALSPDESADLIKNQLSTVEGQ